MPTSTEHLFPISHERDTAEVIRRDAARLEAVPMLREMLEAFPSMAVVLNARRQILLYNALFAQAVPSGEDDLFLGMRLGNSIGCEVACSSAEGCGSGAACRMCGALLAMLDAQAGEQSVRECTLSVHRSDGIHALDFRVLAVPLEIAGLSVSLLSLVDISDEKRRLALERIFFHDILNTASGLRSVADLLRIVEAADRDELIEDLNGLSDQLIDEIQRQRDILAAERGEIATTRTQLTAGAILDHVQALYRYHYLTRERDLRAENKAEAATFESDPTILARVLGNLTKNALEATAPGGCVLLGCENVDDGGVLFTVQNPSVISDFNQTQVFKRSFSTKGAGRGLGTYSARLLTEKYLGGSISFRSDPTGGTTFSVRLPGQFKESTHTEA